MKSMKCSTAYTPPSNRSERGVNIQINARIARQEARSLLKPSSALSHSPDGHVREVPHLSARASHRFHNCTRKGTTSASSATPQRRSAWSTRGSRSSGRKPTLAERPRHEPHIVRDVVAVTDAVIAHPDIRIFVQKILIMIRHGKHDLKSFVASRDASVYKVSPGDHCTSSGIVPSPYSCLLYHFPRGTIGRCSVYENLRQLAPRVPPRP